jgi:GNAT superfamily N-acetyltransferase
MAKRTRGSSRPGHRARLQRPPQRPAEASPRRPGGLTREEETRAAEIEAAILAEERAAQNATRRTRDRDRDRERVAVEPGARGRGLAPLSARAADEYAYVRRDVIRIARIGGGLLAVLAVLYVLIDVTGVIRL